MTSDEVNLTWWDSDPIVLSNTVIRQGKGEINSANYGACMWHAFQSKQSNIFRINHTVIILINPPVLINVTPVFSSKKMLY